MGIDCCDSPFADLIMGEFLCGNFLGGIKNGGFVGLKIRFLLERETGWKMWGFKRKESDMTDIVIWLSNFTDFCDYEQWPVGGSNLSS